MRTAHATVTAVLALAALTAGCSSDSDDSKTKEAKVEAPAYTTANKEEKTKTGRVDLIVPKATVDQAQAAIRDYAGTIGDAFLNYSITVVRSGADKTYVCSGEWVKDEEAAQIYTGGRVKADSWPAIDMNCPDPAGN